MFYFAYGSNMNFKQMEERCGKDGFKFIGRAYLEGYSFVYDGYSNSRNGAVANIVKSDNKNEKVWGGLFEINQECLNKLDTYEGYPHSYNRKEIKVIDDFNNEYKAWIYLRDSKERGEPSENYRNIVIQGAKDCGLPEDYINYYLKN